MTTEQIIGTVLIFAFLQSEVVFIYYVLHIYDTRINKLAEAGIEMAKVLETIRRSFKTALEAVRAKKK